jgi:hypothetical protein
LQAPSGESPANLERVKDLEFFAAFYPGLKSVQAPSGALAWKGPLPLADGSCAQIATIEDPNSPDRLYAIAGKSQNPVLAATLAQYQARTFPAARYAVWNLEHALNQALCRRKKKRLRKPNRNTAQQATVSIHISPPPASQTQQS